MLRILKKNKNKKISNGILSTKHRIRRLTNPHQHSSNFSSCRTIPFQKHNSLHNQEYKGFPFSSAAKNGNKKALMKRIMHLSISEFRKFFTKKKSSESQSCNFSWLQMSSFYATVWKVGCLSVNSLQYMLTMTRSEDPTNHLQPKIEPSKMQTKSPFCCLQLKTFEKIQLPPLHEAAPCRCPLLA